MELLMELWMRLQRVLLMAQQKQVNFSHLLGH